MDELNMLAQKEPEPEELLAAPVDQNRLQEFDEILRKYKAGKAHLERRVVQAEQWWKLRNDSAARKEYDVGWDQDFQSRSGWLHNVLVSKHADAMENYPEAMILPREPGDKDQAKTLSAIIPCILEQTNFESTYSEAWWRKLKTGTAVYKCTWDADALNGLGEISITDVDLLSVFWEPGVRDIQDSRYIFHVELHDNDLLEQQYPELKDKLNLKDAFDIKSSHTEAAASAAGPSSAQSEAVLALSALGYSNSEALRAVRKAAPDHEGADTEELIKAALKELI